MCLLPEKTLFGTRGHGMMKVLLKDSPWEVTWAGFWRQHRNPLWRRETATEPCARAKKRKAEWPLWGDKVYVMASTSVFLGASGALAWLWGARRVWNTDGHPASCGRLWFVPLCFVLFPLCQQRSSYWSEASKKEYLEIHRVSLSPKGLCGHFWELFASETGGDRLIPWQKWALRMFGLYNENKTLYLC